MPSPNRVDRGLLAPPSNPNTSVRNPQNATQSTIMIEPTSESQRFYNQNRRDMDRQRLELHVAENNLEPPQSELMSRSTGSDSHPSPSTVCSHAGDSIAHLSSDPTPEAARSKPHRGRRRGPLDMETRTKTAFKRKFKLTCAFHRAKRISCNCHDFSKLEEGYRMSLVAEGQKTKATRSEPVRSLGDIGTFGTGGAGDTGGAALVIPQYQGFDFPDLSIGRELTPRVHPNLLPVLGLDIDSAASVNAIVSAPREEPFFLPPVAPMPIPMQDEKESIVIGSSTLFHNRWDCEYKREETGLCSWTGPLEQLCDHFSTTHHHFERTEVPAWTICVKCKNISLGWERGDCDCDPGCWRKLFYGVVPRQSNPNPILTVSEAPGSRSSWFSPSWNMATPGSSNTEQSNLPYRSSTSSAGFYEHSTSGNENSEASDGEGKDEAYRVCRTTQNRCRFQSDAAETTQHTCIGSWFGHPRRRTGARSAFYGSHLSLTPPSKLCRRLIIALLAPLIVFHLRRAHFLHKLRGTLVAFLSSVYCLKLYLALIIILGPLVAWIALGSLRSRANGENNLHALASVV